MEKNINIVEILKDKPVGTVLWTDMFGEVTLYVVTRVCDSFQVKHHDKEPWFDEYGRMYKEGTLCIYPSKSMRDWYKFAWKKGDVLSCGVDNLCIFEKWDNDNYTEFAAKFVTPNYSGNTFKTEKWSKETNDAVIKQYISNIEEFKGGKLNLTTLEIEKHPEFKDGDIMVMDAVPSKHYAKCIFILKGTINARERIADCYAFYNVGSSSVNLILLSTTIEEGNIRQASESEKQQLFDALAKENKRWDAEKKQIVNLPKKCEFKPFDKVLVRDTKDELWRPAFFASFDEHCISKYAYGLIGDPEGVFCKYCIPYNEDTKHLLGTTDEWKGGESAQIGSSGCSAKIDSTGGDSIIMCAGNSSIAKAKAGSWITLAEWKWNDEKKRNIPVCVKTEYVDGERIKADTWYKLLDGEFVEVDE